MDQLTQKKRVEVEEVIINAVCQYFGLDVDAFRRSRSTDSVSAYRRHACYYLIRKNTLLSFDKIAALFYTTKSTITCGFYKLEGLVYVKDRRIVGDIDHLQRLVDNFIKKLKEQSLED
jgi:chromosomal replication initiation ATPase DnaA